jgi:hypothetical protein
MSTVDQGDIDPAGLEARALRPERQPVPLASAHADLADLTDHGMEVGPIAVEHGAVQPGPMVAVAAEVDGQPLTDG